MVDNYQHIHTSDTSLPTRKKVAKKLFVANSLPTCLPTVFVPFTNINLSLPTLVCRVKAALDEVALRYPIVFDVFHLCDMHASSKQRQLSVAMLRSICEHFDIDLGNIKERRKAPYLSFFVFLFLLNNFNLQSTILYKQYLQCSCHYATLHNHSYIRYGLLIQKIQLLNYLQYGLLTLLTIQYLRIRYLLNIEFLIR